MTLGPARRMDGIDRTLIRQIFDSAPAGAINLGLGQPDLPTPPRISEAGVAGIAAGRTAYTSTAGDPKLRAAIARRYEPFASGAENVVVTVGSQEALFAALLTILDPGDEVLYPDPGYPAYPVVARLVGAVPVAYPLHAARGFRLDPADVASRLTGRSRVVIVCSPSNPTGAVEREDDLRRLAALLETKGVAWVSDEIYAGFAYDGPVPSLSSFSREGGLVVSGLSKDLSMTGWRIGWAVGHAAILARIIATHQYLVTCASSVSQCAALAALSPEAEAERAEYLEIFRRRRALMAEELARIPRIRFELPQGAFYFFADFSAYGSSVDLCRRILDRRKVVTIPGEAFGRGAPGYVRLSFAATDEQIVAGIRAIADELRGS
jgi:aspartate/methionine/tyrosine aminotransferase